MENISLTLPRSSFSSNIPFTSHKSVYDDVFGGPPKLGLPTLAPRFEDYSEIFGGFHNSQSSSIPVLHLPLIESADYDLHNDIDYTEVFGGFRGFDFTASPQDLAGHSSGGYDSDTSGDPWSPAQSVSLSGDLDPMSEPDKSQRLSDGDSQQSFESIDKKNSSYSKVCHMSTETVLTTTNHETNFSAVPGYTFSLYESPVLWDGEDEHCFTAVTDNINHSREHWARVKREKQYKCSSNSSHSYSEMHRKDYRPVEKHGNSTILGDKAFVTVSDISLRTKPSQLPPPSRPPPVLVDKRRERDKQHSELKPYGRGTGNRNIKENHQGTKELIERKYFRSLSAVHVDEKRNETVRETSDIEDENLLQSHGGKTRISVPVVEERIESIESTEGISGPQVQCFNNSADNPAEAVFWREATGYFEVQAEAECNENEVEVILKQNDFPRKMNIGEICVGYQNSKQTSGKHEDIEGAETRKIFQERKEDEGTEIQHGRVSIKHYENKPEGIYELKESGVILKDAKKHKESVEKSYIVDILEKSVDSRPECDINLIVNECQASGKTLEQATYDKDHNFVLEMDVIEKGYQDVSINDNNCIRMAETEVDNVEKVFETTGNLKVCTVTCSQEELNKHAEAIGPIERNGHNGREVVWDLDSPILINRDILKVLEGGYEVDETTATKVSGKQDDIQMLKYNQREFSSAENEELRNKSKHSSTYQSKTGSGDTVVIGRFHEFSKNKDELQVNNSHNATNNPVKSRVSKQISDSQVCGSGIGTSYVMSDKIPSASGYNHGEVSMMNNAKFFKRVNINENGNPNQIVVESIICGGKQEDVTSFLKHNDDGLSSKKDTRSQQIERKDPIMKRNLVGKEQKVWERIRRETVPENEHMRKIEEEREREREREKDRMAVDKAALEARERSYFEVRERAERAAVERTTAEVRQRALAEAQKRQEKASMEARIRADRSAVERATAEARQRAAEKLMAQKAACAPTDPLERSVPDKFSGSSRSTDTRQSFLSSDIPYRCTRVSNHLRYPYSSVHDGAESESPQRCKARLERYRRTAERAANALAEKNMRDLLAQRERDERTRVAEALDAEVKRWSSGKEGNLRALLSTLQYILGPDSGWHPVSLTEVITSAAVKKAYRRATLCVHPDKLQQRGATIQQKYICEKVFDLLKEAWNKFNSEER